MDNQMSSTTELISKVLLDYKDWSQGTRPWFRGEPKGVDKPLLPILFRGDHNERKLLQEFRMRSPALGGGNIPNRDETDKWLFLARHVGLPTRLLDWTEGLLAALHFSLFNSAPGVVWMLNPDELNRLSGKEYKDDQIQLTWFDQSKIPLQKRDLPIIQRMINRERHQERTKLNITTNRTIANIHYAWTHSGNPTKFPWALPATNIHPRMSSQSARFTIHGTEEESIANMGFGKNILRKYIISSASVDTIRNELRLLGVTQSSLFPELDGIAKELSTYY